MITTINIEAKDYKVTDEEQIQSTEELIFELRGYSDKESKFVIGCLQVKMLQFWLKISRIYISIMINKDFIGLKL